MTRNTGRAQCVHITDPCNTLLGGPMASGVGSIAAAPHGAVVTVLGGAAGPLDAVR